MSLSVDVIRSRVYLILVLCITLRCRVIFLSFGDTKSLFSRIEFPSQ